MDCQVSSSDFDIVTVGDWVLKLMCIPAALSFGLLKLNGISALAIPKSKAPIRSESFHLKPMLLNPSTNSNMGSRSRLQLVSPVIT